jgi:MFS family permease
VRGQPEHDQLIAFRALQGLGGGGLIVLTLAVVGDIFAPRARPLPGLLRRRLRRVDGDPLLGGFFVDNLSQLDLLRDLPVGAIALVVIGWRSLPRVRPSSIDYLGAGCLPPVSPPSCCSPAGGTTYAWGSPEALTMLVVGVVLLAAFPFAERRAAEPILPLELFRNRVFVVTSAVGFIVGLALFGAITYLPLYLQVVKGHSPTSSGLTLTPLMVGLLFTSILSGQLISRYGRYKPFPIVGTAIMTVAVLMLSRLEVGTPIWQTIVAMVVLGLGLGMVMQVLVLAAQNSVDHSQISVATSGSTLFRQIGGSIGVAAFGAIFTNRLAGELAALPPRPHPHHRQPGDRQAPAPAVHSPYVHGLRGAAAVF